MKAKTLKRKLGNFIGVKNMYSSNGNQVPNQFELSFENGQVFQSYDSVICIRFGHIKDNDKMNGKVVLGQDYRYSNTTSKYLTEFTGYNSKEREAQLKSGAWLYCEDLI